jgi:ABC-type polar amino acid transport system ATPase subunit
MIKIRAFSKKFRDHEVLSDVNIDIREGENTVLIGASGSGKTTLIRRSEERRVGKECM